MLRGKYNKPPKKKNGLLCSNEIIISTKEARKILGKEESDKVSDEDLARLIGLMHKIANDLIDVKIVPKNKVAV